MKKACLVCMFAALAASAGAQPLSAPMGAGLSREMTVQLQRYDQLIGRLTEQNAALQSDVRQLQRGNADLQKAMDAVASRSEKALDTAQRIDNTTVKGMSAQVQSLNDRLTNQKDAFDWGSGTRDCAELGNKHQQIKTVQKPDGSKTVRFLCFDGRALHLGTELHAPGE